ncbi:MAG TPA: metallophosphoesterase [Gemmatimonadaceae bacterium]
MLLGLLSDTHDRLPAIDGLIRDMMARGVGMVLHAGDFCSPFALRPILENNVTLAGVFGRNDGDHEGLRAYAASGLGIELFESPHSMEVSGQTILLVHDIGDVAPRSIEQHSVVVHGFTHREEMKTRGDTLIVNPGEGCGWLYGPPSAAILDLDNRRVEFIQLPTA